MTSVDYSAPVIEFMSQRNSLSRPGLRFAVADCRALVLEAAAFDLVLDKARPPARLSSVPLKSAPGNAGRNGLRS